MKSIVALVIFAASAVSGLAQELPGWAAPAEAPSGPAASAVAPPPPPPAAPAPVPLDGGLALLALAGAGYATKRLRAASKE